MVASASTIVLYSRLFIIIIIINRFIQRRKVVTSEALNERRLNELRSLFQDIHQRPGGMERLGEFIFKVCLGNYRVRTVV